MATAADSRTPSRLRSTPSWLITHLAKQVGQLQAAAFADGEWRRYHYALLAALEEFGPASQAALGRRCQIDRSYVVEAINELSDQGLVVRVADPTDRRRNTITITEAGAQRLHQLGETLDEVQDSLLAALSPEERGHLVRLLTRALEHHTHPPAETP
ncbi:MAG TPA: MarR family winged helix-turn-helix transcriptional regulator [Kineosporiaceae bacterium]|nr:MarR family winged helix-turn-helix transcriptional regulator [Kineosporiaceae bacterium]